MPDRTADLQVKRQQIFDSVRQIYFIRGMSAEMRERYLEDKRDDFSQIEAELKRRYEAGDVDAKERPLTGETNLVYKTR